MKRFPVLTTELVSAFFLLICAYSHAQDIRTGAYLIPKIVHVGDMASLVLPLPGLASAEASEIVFSPGSPGFPVDHDIDFHRIILERRQAGGTLLLEFSAFRPGLLYLPTIDIGGERFTGLSVEIRSVIGDSASGLELSPPAAALAMPGTARLIYGTVAALVLSLLLTIWILLRGRFYLAVLYQKWKRRRILVLMKRTGDRLRMAMLNGEKSREILDILSLEFRNFLSSFSGENCRAMTAREFDLLPDFFQSACSDDVSSAFCNEVPRADEDPNLFQQPSAPGTSPQNAGGANNFLGKYFRRCDELRFSGAAACSDDVFMMLVDLQFFLDALDKRLKQVQRLKTTERGKAA